MKLIKKLRVFKKSSVKQKILFFMMLNRMFIIKCKLFFIPFKHLIDSKATIKNKSDIYSLDDFLIAIRFCQNFVFWKNSCMVNSLTLKHLLSKNGINATFHLGMMKNERTYKAHAWISYNGIDLLPKYNHKEIINIK